MYLNQNQNTNYLISYNDLLNNILQHNSDTNAHQDIRLELDWKQDISEKNQVNWYAWLWSDWKLNEGKIPNPIKKHGVINDWLWTILTQWVSNYTFDVRWFTYYINWTKYVYEWSELNNPNFLTWESFAYIWVTSSWLFIKKNAYFTPEESETTILIWLVRSSVWWSNSILDIINDYVFYADEIWKKIYTRYKNFEKNVFLKDAWKITLTWLRLNILWWYFSDDNLDTRLITQENDIQFSYVYHIGWVYIVWPKQSQDINTTQFDNWTNLVSWTTNKFVSHTIARSSVNWNIFVIIWNEEYDTQILAEKASPNYWPLETALWWTLSWIWKVIVKFWTWIMSVIDLRNNVSSNIVWSSWTLQNAYDSSETPEIITDLIRWAFSVKEWTWDDTENIFEWYDNSWNLNSYIKWNWDILVNDLNFIWNKSHWMWELSMLWNTTATTIWNTTDFFKAAWTTTLTSSLSMWFDDWWASNRLRYTWATTRMFHIACSFTFSSNTNNQNLEFSIAKNWTIISTSRQENYSWASWTNQSTALHVATSLATNDYIELYVRNTSSTWTITVKNINLFAMNAN